jgi:hypothetical protein
VRELSKNNPAPDSYQIKRNIEIEQVDPRKPCQFGNGYKCYRRTCDIQREIRVYDYAADKINAA